MNQADVIRYEKIENPSENNDKRIVVDDIKIQ